jgi:hypothetical protein
VRVTAQVKTEQPEQRKLKLNKCVLRRLTRGRLKVRAGYQRLTSYKLCAR